MQFDIDGMAPIDRYELLLGTIVPRPIALITTLGPDGSLNAAPYSLFNVMGHDPAVAMISVRAHPQARLKDTANNIFATKEFVLNLVSETGRSNEHHLYRRAAGRKRIRIGKPKNFSLDQSKATARSSKSGIF